MANKSKQSMARAKQTMEFRTVRSHQSNLLQNQRVNKKNSMNAVEQRESKSLERKQHHVRSQTGGAITTLVKRKSANNGQNKMFTSISSDERQRSHDRAKQTSVNISNKSGKENAVAKHLSKMYFLNSKQLLKLLSPPREPGLAGASSSMLNQTQQAGMQQGEGDLNDELKQWFQSGRNSNAPGQTVRSGTVQAQTGRSAHHQRQRNRSSIGVNLSGEINDQVTSGHARQRNHSHSQSRQKKPLAHQNAGHSTNLGHHKDPIVGTRKSVDQPNQQRKMDRLIKSNLKKQKTKTENEQAMRELLELQQTQRKTQLTLLNKKVRDANKSKLNQNQTYVSTNVPPSTSHMRSLSCQRKRQSLSDERAPAEADRQLDRAPQPSQADKRRKDGKVIPFSATHGRTKGFKFNQLAGQVPNQKQSNSPQSNRPKIFDELNLLTRQIEQEIDQEGGVTANTTKVLEQGRDSSARNSDLNFYSMKARRSKEHGKSLDQAAPQASVIAPKTNHHKKKRASVDIQKFIERQKRKQTIKREREMHIEFDKKLQIQRNLSKLNAFTKRNSKSTIGGFASGTSGVAQTHQRQRSVPSTANRHGLEKAPHAKTMKNKKVKAANKTMSGLRDIFNGAATSVSLNQTAGGPINLANSTDATQQHDYNQYLTAFENSAQINRSQQRQIKYNKAKKQFSGSGTGLASKISNVESGRGTTNATYLPLKHPRQRAINSESFPYHERKRSDFNKSQTIQQRQQILVSVNKSPDAAAISITSDEMLHHVSRNPNATGVSSAAGMHDNLNASSNQVPTQPIAFEKSISSRSELEDSNTQLASRVRKQTGGKSKKKDSQPQTKAEKVEQIRRVHEIVALYRRRFKKGASDASIMGTLHLAASIIQIHFRYQKQLKESRRKRREYLKKRIESREQRSRLEAPPSSSQYINTDKSGTSLSLPGASPGPYIDNIAQSHVDMQGYRQRRPQSVGVQPSQIHANENQRGRAPTQIQTQIQNFLGGPGEDSKETPADRSSHNTQVRTPLIPELDFNKLKQEQQPRNKTKPNVVQVVDMDGEHSAPGANGEDDDHEEKIESAAQQSDAKTVSSYSGIFQRIGMPLPRSARVRVEYGLVSRDPGLIEQIRNLVQVKQEKGTLALKESRQLELISERTYHLNSKKLEKWVAVKNQRLDEMRNQSRSRQKARQMTSEELLAEAEDERERLSKILETQDLERASFASQGRQAINGMKSGRSLGRLSYRSQSWRGEPPANQGMPFKYNPATQVVSKNHSGRKGSGEFSQREEYTSSEQPRNLNANNLAAPAAQQQQQKLGSGRDQKSKIVELINSKSSRSRTNSARQDINVSSESVEIRNQHENDEDQNQNADVKMSDEEVKRLMRIRETHEPHAAAAGHSMKSSSQGAAELEERRSLTKSLLSQLENVDEFLPAANGSRSGDSSSPVEKSSNLIETQLEQALQVEQQREETGIVQPAPSPADADYDQQQQLQNSPAQDSHKAIDDPLGIQNQQLLEQLRADGVQELTGDPAASFQSASGIPNQNAILVENQSQEKNDVAEDKSGRKLEIETGSSSALPGVTQPHEGTLSAPNTHQNNLSFQTSQMGHGHPQTATSPLSDSQAHEIKIVTGGVSLSSTDSDITKVIRAQQEPFDSPPNVLSPQNAVVSLLRVVDQGGEVPQPTPEAQSPQQDPNQQAADELASAIVNQLVAELRQEIGIIVPRQQMQPQRQNYIRYFERRGIKTDLCAIEKYVDEMLTQVKSDEQEFTREIRSTRAKEELQVLFEMQNSEIGTFEHFQQNQPNVLALDLYLELERQRRASRESGDGRFDFENVTDADLMEDRVDRNFLAECQYIHNKVLFDCINDSLQQFRPFGKEGPPPTWSRLSRKLRPTEDFTLVEMFEVAKHDLFRMAIMQAGTLPRREFVFGGQFDEELFTELREKKLAALLCREIVDSEPQWLKWDFEEAQTKVDLSDMVLEHLVTETIEVLAKNEAKRRAAQ